MLDAHYNPDVLSCLANLSSDEIFTPPHIANQMLDLLPEELWSNKDVAFLDPAAKSGVFLREIAKRLMIGLETEIPDLQARVNHIMTKQLFGISITELTSLLARRSVYCSKAADGEFSICDGFDDDIGNIFFDRIAHEWKNGKCLYCGASQQNYARGEMLEMHAYQFIHNQIPERIKNMKFDVIIGNPPYQLSDGGSGTGISAIPLYHKFVEQAQRFNPRYVSMIIPARWYAGGKGLNEFREKMLSDRRISHLVDFAKSRDCFSGVDIAGGVCYFLWDNHYSGDCIVTNMEKESFVSSTRNLGDFPILIRSNEGFELANKISKTSNGSMSTVVHSRNAFGFVSSFRGSRLPGKNSIRLLTSDGESFIDRDQVKRNGDLINQFKVIIGKVNPDRGGVNNASDGKMNVITKIRVLNPGTICSETYLLLSSFNTREEAENCASYFRTKFVRYLISITLSSMNITKENFQFVPEVDFAKQWDDQLFLEKFSLDEIDLQLANAKIRDMD